MRGCLNNRFVPILPEVGDDVCVEVGVAVVQGQGEGEEEAAEHAEVAASVAGHGPGQPVDRGNHVRSAVLSCPLKNPDKE